MVDHLVDRLRYAVSRSREHERAILQLAGTPGENAQAVVYQELS